MAHMDSGLKKLTSIHESLAIEINKCLEEVDIPKLSTKGETTRIQKDSHKGTTSENYRPETCLTLMRKILTAQITTH